MLPMDSACPASRTLSNCHEECETLKSPFSACISKSLSASLLNE